MSWSVFMCLLSIYVLNSKRKRNGVGFGVVHLLGAEVRFAVIFVSVTGLWGGEPWSNWRRRCSLCPLGTGSETCCSGTGKPTTGKGAALYARRTESVAYVWAMRASYLSPYLKSMHLFCACILSLTLWNQVCKCVGVAILREGAQLCCSTSCCNRFSPYRVCAEQLLLIVLIQH